MPEPVVIDDPTDWRLADYLGLTDADLRRRLEHGSGLFIAEGEAVIRRLLRSPYRVRSILVTSARRHSLAADLAGLDAPVYVASREVMSAVAGFDIHRGAVASAHRRAMPDVATMTAGATRMAILEGISDHENLGALFRNAAAFGIDAVALSPTCADPLYRRSVRVSLGHVLGVPYTRLTPWPAALAGLGATGWHLVALTPAADAEPVEVLGAMGGRVALLLGSEGTGLSDAALATAHRRLRIPMSGGVDSLNVATAAAIAFHRLASRRAPAHPTARGPRPPPGA